MCKKLACLSLVLLGAVIDQASKYYAVESLVFNQPQAFIGHINWLLNYNKGVAFGLFNQYAYFVQIGLIAMILAMILGMLIWFWKTPKEETGQLLSLSLIIGGAMGNVIDRILFGHVIDFIDFYVGAWHWPTFNVADSFICIGAGLLALRVAFLSPSQLGQHQ